MSEELRELLGTLGEQQTAIDRVYVLKVGCVAVSPYENVARHSFPITERKAQRISSRERVSLSPDELYAKVVAALTRHPNLFGISEVDTHVALHRPLKTGVILHGERFTLRVRLPGRLQEFAARYSFGEPIEEFSVISDGSLFAAYAEIPDLIGPVFFGHEYRELVCKLLDDEPDVWAPGLGPCPIHPDFYVATVQSEGESSALRPRIYDLRGDVLVVADASMGCDEIAEWLFSRVSLPMTYFYSTLLARNLLLDYYIEISNRFGTLVRSVQDLHAASWWRLVLQGRFARDGRRDIGEIYERIVENQRALFDYQQERKRALDLIQSEPLLSPVFGYFSDQTEEDFLLPESLLEAVGHFQNEIQSHGSNKSTFVASFIGAAVGALLTALLTV